MTASRVAALADVHGNAPALRAVLAELEREPVDAIVFCGDLTWGSFPAETLELARSLGDRARFVRGNADRDVVAHAADPGAELSERERWLAEQHTPADLELLAGFADAVVLEVDELGTVRFCHGSPRSVEECVTEATPEDRLAEALAGVGEDVVVTAHTHVSYDRGVLGKRLLNPGSVGLPYEGRPGAYWALLGPDVEFRRTGYDVDAAVARMRAGDEPGVEQVLELLLEPPSREEAIAHAETVTFSG